VASIALISRQHSRGIRRFGRMRGLLPSALLPLLIPSVIATAQPQQRAADSNGKDDPKLVEATLGMEAAHASWQRSDEEYRRFRAAGGVSELEIQEFAAFVAELKYRAIESALVVQSLGGNVGDQKGEPPERDAGKDSADTKEFGRAKALAEVAEREPTREEKTALLDRQLDEFDPELAAAFGQDPTQGGSTAGGGGGGARTDGGKAGGTQPGGQNARYEPGRGPAVVKDIPLPEYEDKGRGDESDDDEVARQLREAAERESDPELKKRLWEKYKEYKDR